VVVDAGLNHGREYTMPRLMDWPRAEGLALSEEHGRFAFPAERRSVWAIRCASPSA